MERKLAAILSADVQGYSRLMGDDEEATIRTLTEYRDVMAGLIQTHHGRVVDSPGDNLLAEFGSAVDAVQGAVAIQQTLEIKNSGCTPSRRMLYRIGINVGDVVVENGRLYGDGVNIAARLESLADGGGITLSGTVYDQISSKLDLACDYQGEQSVKNINHPIRVYRLRPETIGAASSAEAEPRLPIASSSELPLSNKPSIAVLPFTNMSNDPEQEYFSDGITEDLITDLSQISALFVIARNSVFTYKGRAVKVQQVQQDLGARYVLEGSIRKAGNRVRITAQLIDASTGGHLWAERFDRQLDDIFAVQDEVVQQIVAALEVRLTRTEATRLERNATENIEAYDCYLRGVEQFRLKTETSNDQARQLFEKAIVLDPDYAEAYAYLCRTYVTYAAHDWKMDRRPFERAMEFGRKAVALNEALPLAHVALGFAHLWTRQYDEAITEAERAVALNPNDAEGYAALADILIYAGRPEEAIPLIEKAQRLDPHYPVAYLFDLGRAYYLLGRQEDALTTFKRVITRNPDHPSTHCYLAWLYWELGEMDKAKLAIAEMLRLVPEIGAGNVDKMPYRDRALNERLYRAVRALGVKE